MTKDEMKQEAKEFIDNRYKHEILGKRVQEFFTFWELLCSIVDFAEPREKRIAELENEISILLSCNNCPENKGGYICQKEYEDKCLTQKIQYIKELQEENAELKEQLTKAKEIIKMLHSDCYSIAECEDTNLGLWEDDLAKAEQFLNNEVEK